jgi:hypothetical protein
MRGRATLSTSWRRLDPTWRVPRDPSSVGFAATFSRKGEKE